MADRKDVSSRLPPVLPWSLAALLLVVLLGMAVLLAQSAFDVVVLLVLAGVLLLLQRTVGDWFSEQVSVVGGSIRFVILMTAVVWVIMGTAQGREVALNVLRAGHDRGFRSAVVPVQPGRAPGSPASGSATPVAERAWSRPAAMTTTRSTESRATGTGGSQASGGSAIDLVAPERTETRRPAGPASTRVALRAVPTDEARRMILEAVVTAGPTTVTEGVVEFSLNGVVIARVPLSSSGRAEARMVNLAAGHYRLGARYPGSDDFRESTSETSFDVSR